jgi:hypothetical protein
MDYKKLSVFFMLLCSILFFTACNNKEKANIDNTFYVELVNFTKDSLKQKISENLFGKVSYYKNDKLQIMSLNYVTEDYPDMHFFKQVSELQKNIKENTKKIKMEFKGDYTVDSISYSLQKYVYTNNSWKKYSDMGFIKATNTYQKAKEFAIVEYGKQLVNSLVLYSYKCINSGSCIFPYIHVK